MTSGCDSGPEEHANADAGAAQMDASSRLDASGAEQDAMLLEPGSPGDAGADAGSPQTCDTSYATVGVYDLASDGRSASIEFVLPQPTQQLALRVEPDAESSPHACYGIEDVWLDGQRLVPESSRESQDVCSGCAQPVRLHVDEGYYLLPSAEALAPFERISLRVGVRDCETLLRPSAVFPLAAPTRVRLRYRAYEVRAAETALSLPVSLVMAAPSLLALGEGARAVWLSALKETVARAFEPAGIGIVWNSLIGLAEPPQKVRYAPHERDALDALHVQVSEALAAKLGAGAGGVPVVLSPCLERSTITGVSQPLGTTPHLPGACSVASAAVYASAERCAGGGLSFADGAALGVIVAHELGHHLGLFHVDDDVPFPNDRVRGDPNLMLTRPVSSLHLTDSQIRVLRRHPDLQPLGH